MSMLVPLLIPPLANITAGLAVGLANASQADKSSFSLTIGNRVFTNAEPFPFRYLPFELREQILLYALEASRSLVHLPLPPGHPFNDPDGPFYNTPINPAHPQYRDPATGEQNINGLPTSAWRWLLVCREWWAVLRPKLWEHTRLRGQVAYRKFLQLVDSPDSHAITGFVRELRLDEGFTDIGQLYEALRSCPKLDTVIYSPEPKINFAFPFGIHLIPSTPGPKSITITLPLELITNPRTLAHLRDLPRLTTLNLTFSRFSLEMAQFLASLEHLTHLTMIMPRLLPSPNLLEPFAQGPRTVEGELVQKLERLELHLLAKISEDQLDALRTSVRNVERLRAVTTVYAGLGAEREVVLAPSVEAVLALAEEERERERRERGELAQVGLGQNEGAAGGGAGTVGAVGGGGGAEQGSAGGHWERTTNVRLFGGLIGLRMEAKKQGS